MLIPMPPLWLADAALIAADRFRMPELGFVNVPVQVCETAGIGLHGTGSADATRDAGRPGRPGRLRRLRPGRVEAGALTARCRTSPRPQTTFARVGENVAAA
jgi:hypothetical protein